MIRIAVVLIPLVVVVLLLHVQQDVQVMEHVSLIIIVHAILVIIQFLLILIVLLTQHATVLLVKMVEHALRVVLLILIHAHVLPVMREPIVKILLPSAIPNHVLTLEYAKVVVLLIGIVIVLLLTVVLTVPSALQVVSVVPLTVMMPP